MVKRPESYKETRIVNKRKANQNELPSLSLQVGTNDLYTGLYKGEIAINDYASNTVISSTGIYFRVGSQETELEADNLIRIGPAYVTSDAAETHVQIGTVSSYSSSSLVITNPQVNQLNINQKIYTLTSDKQVNAEFTILGFTIDNLILTNLTPSGTNFTTDSNIFFNQVGVVNTYQLSNSKYIISINSSSNLLLKESTLIYSSSGAKARISAINNSFYELTEVEGTWAVGQAVYTDLVAKVSSFNTTTKALVLSNLVISEAEFYVGRSLYSISGGVAVSGVIQAVSVTKYQVTTTPKTVAAGEPLYLRPRPTVPNVNNSRLVHTGQIWLRTTDQAVFINNGSLWQRITPIAATPELQGLVELANQQEVDTGLDNTRAITPLTLNTWMENKRIVQELDPSFSIYVDSNNGDDSLSNDGSDQYRPFRTIERALIQAARISYVAGTDNDLYGNITINIGPGEYVVDNRPGSDLNGVEEMPASAEIINPLQIGLVGTAGYKIADSTIEMSLSYADEIFIGKQLFAVNNDGEVVGKCVLASTVPVSNAYKVKQVTGAWIQGTKVIVPQHKLYNPSAEGGIVVPRGCSLIGRDLRKTKIIPKYLGDLETWLLDDKCQGAGRTSIFKLTGGCLLTSFTFTDNPEVLSSHHLCTTVEFASSQDLSTYYSKIVKGLRLNSTPAMVTGQLEAVQQENTIVANTTPSEINSVKGTSPYVFNCSVLSRYGLCGMLVDGNKTNGFKSFVTAQFTNISLQVDPRAFETGTTDYIDKWRHYAFKAINNGYVQIVSCFVIANAAQYVVETGGEISITNSCSNFGDLSLVADGGSVDVLPQDEGGSVAAIVPPKPIPVTPIEVPILGFKSSLMQDPDPLSGVKPQVLKLHLDGTSVLDRLAPYTLLHGEEIYILGTSAKIVSSGPIVGEETVGNITYAYINIDNSTDALKQSNKLNIYNKRADLDLFPVNIRRRVDRRTSDQKIYWLKVTGMTPGSKRRPLETFLLRFAGSTGKEIPGSSPLFIALTRDKDLDNVALPVGAYYIAILSGGGLVNDIVEEIYPGINIDNPDDNPTTSLTYKSTAQFLINCGMTQAEVTEFMKPSVAEKVLPITGGSIRTDFVRPSLIRASGHTWEWVGYGNYSTAMPEFQTKVLSFQETLSKIKRETKGGRVFCTGMDENGNFIVGNKVFDLKTGDERNLQGDNNDSKVFKNVTVSQRLLMSPASTLDLRSMNLGINAKTAFSSDSKITPTADTYAKEEQGGFIELATESEVQNRDPDSDKIDPHRAVTPRTLVSMLRSVRNNNTNSGGVDINDLFITSKLETKPAAIVNLTSSSTNFTKAVVTLANTSLNLQGISSAEPTKLTFDNNTEVIAQSLDKATAKYYSTTNKPGLIQLATANEVQNRNIPFNQDLQVDIFDNIDPYNAITPRTLQQLFRSRRGTNVGGVEIRDLKILNVLTVEPPPPEDVSVVPTVDMSKARLSFKEAKLDLTGTDTKSTTVSINKDTELFGVTNVQDLSTFKSYSTTSKLGLVELATNTEAKNKADEYRAITSAVLAHVMDLMMPVGTILESVSNTAPTYGVWMSANGDELNASDYPEYVQAVSPPTPSGKFKLPDRRNRVSVGASNAYPLKFDDGSHNYGGFGTATLDVENMPKHTHTIEQNTHHHQVLNDGDSGITFVNTNIRGGSADTDASPGYVYTDARGYTTKDHTHAHIAAQTGGTPSQNAKEFSIMQPYIVCKHYVRVK